MVGAILVLVLIFFIPFIMVIEAGGSGGIAFIVSIIVLGLFLWLIYVIVNSTEENKKKEQTKHNNYNNEVIKEYQYKDFKIKQVRSGEYLVEYKNNSVNWAKYSIDKYNDNSCKLENGFKYGKKITIEKVYKNLRIAERLGYYC